jgi:hypothetical protein
LLRQFVPSPRCPQQERSDDKMTALRNNEIPHLFYLPERENLPESYAALLVLTPIHRTFFSTERIPTHLVARLSATGMMALQHGMSEHFGVQFGFDHEDVCTQAGRYRCSNCFHVGNGVNTKAMVANQPFGTCDGCGADAAWSRCPFKMSAKARAKIAAAQRARWAKVKAKQKS